MQERAELIRDILTLTPDELAEVIARAEELLHLQLYVDDGRRRPTET